MSYKNNHAYKFFNREEPEEVKRLCDVLPLEITHGELADLFELLLDSSVDEGESSTTIGDGLLTINIINLIDFEGSAEYSSYESSTDIEIHDKEGNELCEVYYAIGTAHCSDSNLMHFEVILPERETYTAKDVKMTIDGKDFIEDNDTQGVNVNMESDCSLRDRLFSYSVYEECLGGFNIDAASGKELDRLASLIGLKRKVGSKEPYTCNVVISETGDYLINGEMVSCKAGDTVTVTTRTDFKTIEKEEDKDVAKLSTPLREVNIQPFKLYETKLTSEDLQKIKNIGKGEWKMTNTLRTVNVTLIDNNSNLKGEAKVVFQKKDIVTEYSDEDTKMNIIAEGEVAKALSKHNEGVRSKTVDRDILRSTGRDVSLDPIELLSDSQLSWSFVQVA